MIYLGKKGPWKSGIIPYGKRMGIYYWKEDGTFGRMSTTQFARGDISLGQATYHSSGDIILKQIMKSDEVTSIKDFNHQNKFMWKFYWNVMERIKEEIPASVLSEIYSWPHRYRAAVLFGYSYLGDRFEELLGTFPATTITVAYLEGTPRKKRQLLKRDPIDICKNIYSFSHLLNGFSEENAEAFLKIDSEIPRSLRGRLTDYARWLVFTNEHTANKVELFFRCNISAGISKCGIYTHLLDYLASYCAPGDIRAVLELGVSQQMAKMIGKFIGCSPWEIEDEEFYSISMGFKEASLKFPTNGYREIAVPMKYYGGQGRLRLRMNPVRNWQMLSASEGLDVLSVSGLGIEAYRGEVVLYVGEKESILDATPIVAYLRNSGDILQISGNVDEAYDGATKEQIDESLGILSIKKYNEIGERHG